MKFISDKVKVTNKKETWHLWFAWYPVSLENQRDQNITAWLEIVERKGCYGYNGWTWRYQEAIWYY